MFYAPFVILTLMFAPRWLLWLFGLLLAAGAGALWGSWKLFRRIVFGQKR